LAAASSAAASWAATSLAITFAFEVGIEAAAAAFEAAKVSNCESKLALEQIRHNPFMYLLEI
jgi:hypothetical protein